MNLLAKLLAAGRDLAAPPPGSPGLFALADPDRTRTLLASAGFSDVRLNAGTGPCSPGPIPMTCTASCSAS